MFKWNQKGKLALLLFFTYLDTFVFNELERLWWTAPQFKFRGSILEFVWSERFSWNVYKALIFIPYKGLLLFDLSKFTFSEDGGKMIWI